MERRAGAAGSNHCAQSSGMMMVKINSNLFGEPGKGDADAEARAARRKVYVTRAQRLLLLALLRDGIATGDVWAGVDIEPGMDRRLFGDVPRPLVKADIIVTEGMSHTTREESHGSYRGAWKLINRPAAEAWLQTHPEPVGGGGPSGSASASPVAESAAPALAPTAPAPRQPVDPWALIQADLQRRRVAYGALDGGVSDDAAGKGAT